MRKFLIDSSWMAVSRPCWRPGCLRLDAARGPGRDPRGVGISEHAAACHVCRLPRYGPDGEPSMLGPEPRWAKSTPRRARGAVEEPLLICRAGRPADGEPRGWPTGRVRLAHRVSASGGI